MFCRKCGKEISMGQRFCKHCGTAVVVSDEGTRKEDSWFMVAKDLPVPPGVERTMSQDQSDSSEGTTRKRQTWRMWVLFSGVACCILVLILWFVVPRHQTDLDKQEVEEQLNTMLATVYEASSPDNFVIDVLDGNVDICVDRIYEKDDNYIAECTVSSLDVATAIKNYLNSLTSDKNAQYTDILKALENEIRTAPIVTKTFDVRFADSQGIWEPVIPEEMIIFCCGNVHELLPLIYDIVGGGVE